MDEIISKLPESVKANCRIVGKWLWLKFDSAPSRDIRLAIAQLGFRWNSNRMVWQNSCGYSSKPAKGYDPRDKYGEKAVI